MPYFSVVIPVFNKEKFIESTLNSVLNQTFSDFEIILVNDGSTDESEAKILAYQDSRIKYFFKNNEGVARTRNFGVEKTTADHICFLDADDFWYPTFLETMYHYFQKYPDQKIAACAIEIETTKTVFHAHYSVTKNTDFEIVDFFKASEKMPILWTSSVVIHKNVFEEVGLFDPNIKKGEDTELWIRIGLHFPILFIWKILARYVYDDDSISRNNNYFFDDYTFQKYALEEKKHPALKKFMDLNRYSKVIKCKLIGDWETAKNAYTAIDFKNLNWKKKIIIQMPPFILKMLIHLKSFLTNSGLGHSVFR